ncbi:amidohydrolase [Diaminobutyricimonas sp. LJ205]|uniref:amidohydrolase n=1 Tax=Diaminobutyricimonas sp. LJ205 TaxID=2683590 RepID=UPI0012F4D23B|nr:amidohydrolase [Diaminobutyricimonas sp. LJ205]
MATTETIDAVEAEMAWEGETYRKLHQRPELSGQEHETAQLIEDKLVELGYEVHRIGGTGVVGVLENGPGATVLARADIDALPITEASGLDYASEVMGVMHSCGHDMHTASLLGAAKLIADFRGNWTGTYLALFQPAEETAAGAQAMVDDGLVARLPRPDVALAQHVGAERAGAIGVTTGAILSAADSIRITVHGRGGHGSAPQLSVDPVVLAASIVSKLQTIVSREVHPSEFAVVTVGAINAGTKSNIIPDKAELLVNVRTYAPSVRAAVTAAIERIVHGECSTAGSPREPEFEYYDQFPLTDNDADVTQRVTNAFVSYFGEDNVFQAVPKTASDDFSTIPDAFGTAYTYWTVGCVPADRWQSAVAADRVRDIPLNHSPGFAPAIDPTLAVCTAAQVVAALAWLRKSR